MRGHGEGTILTISGHCRVFLDEETVEIKGYAVLAASAGRKQALLALTDSWITMSFASDAESVEQAERELIQRNTAVLP